MITYRFVNGNACLSLVCDACRKTIEVSAPNYGGAMALWDAKQEEHRKEGALFRGHIYHAHKGECWYRVDSAIEGSGGCTYDMDIENELSDLLHNTGYKADGYEFLPKRVFKG